VHARRLGWEEGFFVGEGRREVELDRERVGR
jgi:hypothetical protein